MCCFALNVDLATLPPAVKPSQGAAHSRCQSNGDYGKSLPTSSTSRWCGKWEGLVAGSQQERLPRQTDTALSRSSVSSGTVLAGAGVTAIDQQSNLSCWRELPFLHTHTHTHSITQTGGRGWCQISPSVNGPWTAYTHAISNILQWTWHGWQWQSATSPNWVAHATSARRMAIPPGKTYETQRQYWGTLL